jgi:hypothetical protein
MNYRRRGADGKKELQVASDNAGIVNATYCFNTDKYAGTAVATL